MLNLQEWLYVGYTLQSHHDTCPFSNTRQVTMHHSHMYRCPIKKSGHNTNVPTFFTWLVGAPGKGKAE